MTMWKLLLSFIGAVAAFVTLTGGVEKWRARVHVQNAFEAAERQDWEKAYRLLHPAVEERRQNRKVHLLYFQAAHKTGRRQDCERAVEWFLTIFPEDFEARHWKTVCASAEKWLEASKKAPSDFSDWLSRRVEAISAAAARNWPRVFLLLEPQVEVHLDDREACLTYIQAAFETGHLGHAHAATNRLLESSPGDPELRYWKGVLYLAAGEAARAIGYLESAVLRLRNRAPEAHMYLGIAYLKEKQKAAGCGALRRYMDVGGDSVFLERTQQSLRSNCARS